MCVCVCVRVCVCVFKTYSTRRDVNPTNASFSIISILLIRKSLERKKK